MKRECDRLWQVDAFREGALSRADAESHERHRAVCAECRLRFEQDEHLVRLGRSVLPALDAVRVRRMRMQILRRAAESRATRPPLRGWVPAVALALALAVVALPWMARRALSPSQRAVTAPPASAARQAEPPSFAAQVEPSPAATWSRERDGQTERVHLLDGTVELTVRHQQPSERFFVVLPDGEVEVRGTRFDVTVRDARTRSVHVSEGVVALRLRGQPERLLAAGAAWALEVEPRSPIASPPGPPPSSAPRVRAASPAMTSAPGAAEIAETEYARAMQLYDAHRYDEASSAFRAFATAHPEAPEAEDAEFLEASSLAFSGRADAAAMLAKRFLSRHPTSFHARNAALLVARAARDRGDCDKARSALAPWSNPAGADVATALGPCAKTERSDR